ncbi:g-strand specific single-stranded telomere-binding protein 1 [Genlisea aurea]|uniref:G-strand specific single-stranded telomere-binding protein 1 n=1 Tax=Genlisea aurea TaxID=192259 RepID=S8E8A4_9LAMI|nr:g-strand specific single-stranded telomere-binding protein 1 [Genlisea aurea]
MGSRRPDFGDGASPGKIFIGGLAKDTSLDTFVKYFGKYGEITDSVIMKDRQTGRPRGFGFITYAEPAVVDVVIAETHIINGKQVEIKRTIPKGSGDSRDFKTKKIFVGGISTAVTEDEFKSFFSKYGKVVEHEIIRDHLTKRSRGFGFIVFDNEQVVDDLLADGNMIDMAGTQVEIKKAEPKKPSNLPPAPAYGSDSRGRGYGDSYGGFGNSYNNFGGGGAGFGPAYNNRSFGSGYGSRFGDYGGPGEFGGGRYGDYGSSEFGYREGPLGYPSGRYASYGGGGFGGGGGGYGGGGLGGYARGGGGGGYGGPVSGGGYDSGPGIGYGGAGGMYGGRTGYGGGGSRYHPYAR